MKTIYAVYKVFVRPDERSRVEAFTFREDATEYAEMLTRTYSRWLPDLSYEVVEERR